VPDQKSPDESDSVLLVKWVYFPEDVGKWILVESCDVLESSPFLSHISWFSCWSNKLCEITIGLLGKRSKFKTVISYFFKENRGTFRSCQLSPWCWEHHRKDLGCHWFSIWSDSLDYLYRIDTQSYCFY